jgi:hypothetical protein
MTSKFRHLLLLTLFVGLTCGLTGVSAQTGGGNVPVEGGGAADSVGDLSALTGKWVGGQLGVTAWSHTGSYANGNGSRVTYQFLPGGTVEYASVTDASTADCRNLTYIVKKGRVSVSGDTLTIKWGRGLLTRELFCGRANNSKETIRGETETLKFAFKNPSYGKRQLCTGVKVAETCYSRAE